MPGPLALFLLVEPAHLFGQVTLAVTMQHWPVLVDTIFCSDPFLIELPVQYNHRFMTELKKHQQDQTYVRKLLHWERIVKSNKTPGLLC
jgi:hypothetical protein